MRLRLFDPADRLLALHQEPVYWCQIEQNELVYWCRIEQDEKVPQMVIDEDCSLLGRPQK
jgi:hypothetical protein